MRGGRREKRIGREIGGESIGRNERGRKRMRKKKKKKKRRSGEGK